MPAGPVPEISASGPPHPGLYFLAGSSIDGTGAASLGKPDLLVSPAMDHASSNDDGLATNTNHSRMHNRNRSSVDGTKYKDGQWSPENERIVMGPYDYMLQHPGKDIRRQLINAFNMWLKVPPESLSIITKVVAMLHTASLL